MAKKTTKRPAKTRARTARPKAEPPVAPPPSPPDLLAWRQVNRVQLGALIGVHPDTITDYARQGMPVVMRGGAGKEGVYDAVACLAWWRSTQGQDEKEAAQARAYAATAQLNELKFARESGKLVAVDDVVLAGQACVKAWTARVRALPRQLVQAGVLERAQEDQAAECLRHVLEEISRWQTMAQMQAATRTEARHAASR